MILRDLYYHIRPIIPRPLQVALRKKLLMRQRETCSNVWPIDRNAGVAPAGFKGWPDGKKFAVVLTHDIETARGQDRSKRLVELEMGLGFKSTINFVPERYEIDEELQKYLNDNEFEIGVHGLYHDGKLYNSKKTFDKRVIEINKYIHRWRATGFRSPSMHSNLDWIHTLDIDYDSSTFDTDPFEPQAEGTGMIFPFVARRDSHTYIELPYTMPQDITLFVIIGEDSIDIWKKKLDWIVEHGGMMLLTTHPDYMNFDENRCVTDEYPVKYYSELLEYIKERYKGQYWQALCKDMARYWKENFS